MDLRHDDRPRRLKLSLSLLAAAGVLIAVTALLTTHLTTRAVEERLNAELVHTVALLGGGGFPLGDPALRRVSEFIQADVVAVDAGGALVASSLEPARRDAFARARASGEVPAVPAQAMVTRGLLGDRPVTIGVAPLGPERRGGVYVLYPQDLLAQEARAAWLPITGVALMAALLAAALGVLSERLFQRARSAALLRLLAAVGHEVRNPLGAIRSLAQSLKRRLGAGVDPRPLDLIAAEAERLTLLVDGLRAIGLPLRTLRRELEPDRLVDEVLGLLAHQLEHRRVRVERVAGAPARVAADPDHLRQVVLNLLLNAADAMPRGGEVRVWSEAADGCWRLVVEDQGPGVDARVRARLFSAFVSTKPKGLGVGLYLSRRLVEANGGALTLDAACERGARFVVSWPLAADGAREPAAT